jgi:hypothetical protein
LKQINRGRENCKLNFDKPREIILL